MFRHINREIISNVISEEVVYYKISTENTLTNAYGEASPKAGRFYYPGVLLNCLREVPNQTNVDNDTGPDQSQTGEFRFLRDDLVDINLVPETGDILLWKGSYYEVDNIMENQNLGGQDPDYALSNETNTYGSSWSILLEVHYTRPTKLNITQERI